MNIIVEMGTDESKIKEFLDVLTEYTNVKWRGDEFCPKGYAPNDEDSFHLDIALEIFDAYYFIVEDDILCWDDEGVIRAIPTDKFDKYESLDEVIKDIKKKNNKLNIRNAVIKATDDKYGRILVNFLSEFTNVTWNNGDKLEIYGEEERYESKLGFDILKAIEGFEYLIFIIEDNRMTWDTDVYIDEIKEEREDSQWYDSVSEFLKSFSK